MAVPRWQLQKLKPPMGVAGQDFGILHVELYAFMFWSNEMGWYFGSSCSLISLEVRIGEACTVSAERV